ncbi:hypothetical protein NDI85_19930 [Halomicroarcula sp. S1AR25-4]|uniref:hypothetical protein n=1 Tax=Haloarcula sp. S1AR25-4 TaxID=2950538 RepID=UPI002874B888|nr:hypothetical protein [Halomicroarcula sp. S1AR25-4]MDS0280058.1 hypothetical protein [Halomicroarcula sp. S1AR25-4]
MNSDKAAAVRDSINGCPDVVGEDDLRERDDDHYHEHYSGEIRTGDRVEPSADTFRPAYIEQSGTLGDGDGSSRPVYVVVLEPIWKTTDAAACLSQELVYEVAKHDCRLRFYPPDHRLGGTVWVTDHFSEDLSNTDGDRCPECSATYWKLRDGEPECARCGHRKHSQPTDREQVTVGDYT